MTDKLQLALPKDMQIGGRYKVNRFLGRGGAGEVYEVEQLGLGITRALKILNPTRHELEDEFVKTFKEEVEHLSQLTHANILIIVDYQTLSYNGEDYPYFVMEYANGGGLVNAMYAIGRRDELLDLFEQLFGALAYIHDNAMMHGDIKPENILFHNPGGQREKIQVKIGDLGVSKLWKMAQKGTATPGQTFVWGTRNYAAPEIREYLNDKAQPIDDQWLKEHKVEIDLFSLGVTVADLISKNKYKADVANSETIGELLDAPLENIVDCLSKSELAHLKRTIRKLTEWDASKRYASVTEALAALRRMTPRHMAFGAIPELTGVGCTRKINHNNRQILFSESTFRWLNHPAIQRLHNLNQLNLLYQVYPGARHSRFSHILETFETARSVTLHLLNDSGFRFLVSEKDITLFLAVSLLHDVGHYPLAHSLEDLRPRRNQPGQKDTGQKDTSQVRADYELIRHFLDMRFEENPSPWNEPLWDILDADKIEVKRLESILSKTSTLNDVDSVFQTLLDGAFDIDKISYLRHDSQTTSVPYGSGIDIEGLFTSLTVLLPSGRDHQITRAQIGLLSRGVSAAESVITARYHMYDRVYWHRTNRALIAMLAYAANYLFDKKHTIITFSQYIEETRSLGDLEAVRLLSKLMQVAIQENRIESKSGRPIRNILPSIIDGGRLIHKRLITFIKHDADPELGRCQERLFSLRSDEIEDVRLRLLDIISQYTHLELFDDEVLIDIPQARKDFDALPSEALWVVDDKTENLYPFTAYSKIATATRDQYQSLANRSRIFVSPRVERACEDNQRQLRQLRREIIEYIDS